MTRDNTLAAVMFDLDGTLLDTAPDFVVALNRLRAEQQLPALPAARIRQSVSNGARALVELGFNVREGEPGYEPLRERLLDLYMRDIARHTRLFPGMESLLAALAARGIPWGLATNKPALYTEELLRHLPLEPGLVVCPDHVTRRKPDPESLLLAASHFGCEPGQMVYLGDHQRDIDCGRRAGALTIACGFGYIESGDSAANWRADYVVASGEEIWPLLERHYHLSTDPRG